MKDLRRWQEQRSDKDAARAICTRRGPGKLKHVAVKYFWIQEAVARKLVKLTRVDTNVNVADVGTKSLTAERIRKLSELAGIHIKITDKKTLRRTAGVTEEAKDSKTATQRLKERDPSPGSGKDRTQNIPRPGLMMVTGYPTSEPKAQRITTILSVVGKHYGI